MQLNELRRRDFLTLVGGAAAWPFAARAQGADDLPRVAILSPDPAPTDRLQVFLGRLRELGYVEGRNIRLDPRFAASRYDLLPALAAELVKARPAVIFTSSTPGAFAAAGATPSIPIVVAPTGTDTMEQLAGKNFAKPVANVTGFTLDADAGGEAQDRLCLQLLKEAAPSASRIAVVVNPDNPGWRDYPNVLKEAAPGAVLIRVDSRGAVDIGSTLSHYTNGTVDGLFLGDDSQLAGDSNVRARVIEFVREQHLPSATTYVNYAREGGLLSLGTDMVPIFRSAAEYVHRIILGARPSELPVQRPGKFELVVNLKTAKALGLTIPPSILARANEVIE
jgi:putative ABC transport system substrate-binding protein